MDSISDRISLSPGEEKILKLLVVGKATDTKTLAEKYYRNKKAPHNGQITIANMVRSLVKKTERNTPYVVRRGKRQGPYPMTVSLEKRA